MIEDQVRQLNEQAEALKAQGECEVEAWLVMNENGDYQLGIDETQAAEQFHERYGGERRRTFRLLLTLPLPEVTEVCGRLPEAEQETYSLEVKPASG